MTNDLWRAADQFPLGPAAGITELGQAEPSGKDTRPFGLRYVTDPDLTGRDPMNISAIDYDTDRQIAPMLPEVLTLGRLFVPFDLVSRTMMVACCNPFDSAGRDAVQQSVDYTVSWYLARPSSIVKTLQSVYRLDSRA